MTKLTELKERQNIADNVKLNRIYVQFGELLKEVDKKTLPPQTIESINKDIEELNAVAVESNDLTKLVKQKQTKIIKALEKEHKIVPKNYYRNLWLALGMAAFGMPLGVAFGVSMGNMGLIGIGLPIGMAIGIAVGLSLDKKALGENRQLNVEIKY